MERGIPALISVHLCSSPAGFLSAFQADPAWHDGLVRTGPAGKPHLDLPGLLRAQARQLGLDPLKDGSVNLCTVCQPDLLWSYRRGDVKARQWGWVRLA
ncbi:MAG TPA: laccase domain-containing protein [Holophagaceae bacterium]|nr:laccase domain-containing protein [Holophagaceae bacterium]